jgi:hypothetical protein
MNEAVFVPMVLVVTLTLATMTQLHDLAQDASDKAVAAATAHVAAIDCAYEARPLTECSPEIFSVDYTEEIERNQAILADLRESQTGPRNGPKDKPKQA